MKKENRIKIARAIKDKHIEYLTNLQNEVLVEFNSVEDGLNAFLFACANDCGFKVIKLILLKAIEHFSNKISLSEEFKNLNIGSDDEIDIDDAGEVGKEFYNYFYGTVKVSNMELNAAALAFKHHDKDTLVIIKEHLFIDPVHDDFLKTKKEREELFNKITNKHGDKQSSRYSSTRGIVERPERSFAKEREKQILKQLSTVLFFYIKNSESKKLTEIEIMHIRIGEVSHLIVSCNGGDDLGNAFNNIKKLGDLQNKIKENIEIKGGKKNEEGRKRVARYKKILGAIFDKNNIGFEYEKGNTEDDIKKYRNIIEVLSKKEVVIECVDNYLSKPKEELNNAIQRIFDNQTSLIIILDNKEAKKDSEDALHAEEYLVEFFNLMLNYKSTTQSDKVIYSCIGGKKRPCFTCHATMLNSYINKHGTRPGYAWKASLHHQRGDNAKITLLSMLGEYSYVTLSSDGKMSPSYDSGSDDAEIEIEKEVYKLNPK